LSNAIKYRKQDQKLLISIHSELVDNVFKITFSDNGLGMDLIANPNKLFKPYSRFHADILGKGIGLYLVQSQIQMLGGTIKAESQVNVGTTFIITIPV
jgi:signal transduction histidine kinase